jgi:hypothetical protein
MRIDWEKVWAEYDEEVPLHWLENSELCMDLTGCSECRGKLQAIIERNCHEDVAVRGRRS